jgi:molybdenum cofactor biosynthesis enzyme
MAIFGGSRSRSETTTNTTNVDRRVVADGGSVVLSTSGREEITLNQLDQGAVANALDFARSTMDLNTKTLADLVGLSRNVVSSSIDAQIATQEAARGAVPRSYLVAIVALVAVALVGARYLRS